MPRSIVTDLIVTASGPGWRLPQARMLVDSGGNVALFTPPKGGPPARTFTTTQKVSPSRGTFTTDTGDTVSYRRRGSSCSWPYAKCRIGTQALAAMWPETEDLI